jgi:hypothetical protein
MYARITVSQTQSKYCDLSGHWIPQDFPFISFGDSKDFGGHISLSGFYRQLEFLCRYRIRQDRIEGELIFKMLVDRGIRPELIVRLCEAGSRIGRPLKDIDAMSLD